MIKYVMNNRIIDIKEVLYNLFLTNQTDQSIFLTFNNK